MTRSFERVAAMVTRYLYLLRSSWPRIVDLVYWPTVQMVTWGFIQTFVSHSSAPSAPMVAAGSLIGAVMLWDILFRGQLGFSMSFLEEMYSRNIGNLMMSPLRPLEFVAALIAMSLLRLAIANTRTRSANDVRSVFVSFKPTHVIAASESTSST